MNNWKEQYKLFKEGKFDKKYLIVGYPSHILLKAGVPYAEIRIGQSNMKNHFQKHSDVKEKDLDDLDRLLEDPLFILAYFKGNEFAGYTIALNSFKGNNILYIGLRPIYKDNKTWLEANIITTFHYKKIKNIIKKLKEDKRPLKLYVQIKKLNQLLAEGTVPSDTKELIQQFVGKYNSKKLPDQMFFTKNIEKITSHLSGLGFIDSMLTPEITYNTDEGLSGNKKHIDWNEFLDLYSKQTYPYDAYDMGYPSPTLLKAGVPNLPIKLLTQTLDDHLTKHPDVRVKNLYDLPKLINDPLMIFYYKGESIYQGSVGFTIVTFRNKNNNPLVIGIHPKKDKQKIHLVVNSITTLHFKKNSALLKWIEENKLLYINIKKLFLTTGGGSNFPTYYPAIRNKILSKYNSKKLPDQMFFTKNIEKITSHLSGLGITDMWNGYVDAKGMQPTYAPADWNSLIKPAVGLSGFIKNGNVNDTVTAIHNIIYKNYKEVCPLAQHLKASTIEQTAFNIWHWARTHIRYHNDDPGTEQLRTPARSWADRNYGVDCDDYSILVASLLLCMGYKPQLVIVAYHGQDSYAHIFVLLPKKEPISGLFLDKNILENFTIIDPVYYRFNSIIPYITKVKIFKPMKIEELSGISTAGNIPLAGIGYGYEVPPNTISRRIMQNYGATSGRHRRIANFMLAHNNSFMQLPYALVMPYMHDVSPDGNIIWQSEPVGRVAEQFLGEVEGILGSLINTPGQLGDLGNWLKNSWNGFKKGVTHAWHKASSAIHHAAQQAKKAAGGAWQGVKKVGLAAPRNAYLLLLRINAFGFATKWYVGLLTRSQAQQLGIPLSFWQKRVKATQKLFAFWKKIGGSTASLKKAILAGKSHRPLLSKTAMKMYKSGLKGLGSATVAATASAASTIIAAVAKWLKENWTQVADFIGKAGKYFKKHNNNGNGNGADNTTVPDIDPKNLTYDSDNIAIDTGTKNSDSGSSSNKWLLPVILGGGALLFMAMKH